MISRQTLNSIKKRFKESGRSADVFKTKPCLSAVDDVDLMQSIICCRDKNGNGMSQKEVISMVMDICGASSMKAAENHFDYLIRSGKLQKLKRGGRVIKAQPTTTKRCCINVAQQLRWHGLIDSVWEEQRHLNQPTEEDFVKVSSHFMFNLDETCVVASEGNLRVVADKTHKKTRKEQ